MTEITNTDIGQEMTVGEILRNARTTGRRKREIQTVSKQLCIREEFLQALEDGNYDVIPETVYILGFARNYAMELGLDPDEIVTKLKKEMGLISEVKEDEIETEQDTASDTNIITSEKWYVRWLNVAKKYVKRNWLWLSIVLGAVVIVIVTLTILLSINSSDDSVNSGDSVVMQVEKAQEPKYKVSVRERFGTENAEVASVILQATQESWVKVEDARGNTVFSRVLVPGDVYYVPDGKGYAAVFGNAGGVDVWVNGVLAPKQGADHVRVADISLNPEKLLPSAVKSE